ncbi:MAG: hypothetical protein AVDCRST_MAG11-778, partial [uncultured Gemmatimonadaceae bacterium]
DPGDVGAARARRDRARGVGLRDARRRPAGGVDRGRAPRRGVAAPVRQAALAAGRV